MRKKKKKKKKKFDHVVYRDILLSENLNLVWFGFYGV